MGTFGSAVVCLEEDEEDEEEKRREVERLPPLLEDEVRRMIDRCLIDSLLMINTVVITMVLFLNFEHGSM